jgi:agmatinase
MRRASEMPWVRGMAQIGLHAVGSARQGEVDDALAYGSVQVRAEEVHEIRVDADGPYAPLAPGVLRPGHGGLTYYEGSNLLRGITRKGTIGCTA